MIRVFCLVTGHWNLWASAHTHSKNIIYFSWRLTDLYFWQLMQFFTRPILCKFQLKECGACRQVLQRTIRYRTKSQIPIIRLSVIWQKSILFFLSIPKFSAEFLWPPTLNFVVLVLRYQLSSTIIMIILPNHFSFSDKLLTAGGHKLSAIQFINYTRKPRNFWVRKVAQSLVRAWVDGVLEFLIKWLRTWCVTTTEKRPQYCNAAADDDDWGKRDAANTAKTADFSSNKKLSNKDIRKRWTTSMFK